MKAIILAAGRGSRMKELTEEVPKCLIKLHGKCLLEWQLNALRKAGISEVGIVTGYRRELLESYDLFEFHNERWAETNMVSSLECADSWLSSDPCIVSYSDIFYDAKAVKCLISSSSELALTYDPDWLKLWEKRFGDPLEDAETFRLDTDGNITEIGNRPKNVEEVEGQYMGLLRFTPKGWTASVGLRSKLNIEEQDRMHMTGLLNMLVQEELCEVAALVNETPWGELDSQSDLRLYTD